MLRLILPKTFVELPDNSNLIFLAGPIRGAPSWQDRAIRIINKIDDSIYLASPSMRLGSDLKTQKILGDDSKYERQTPWEAFYIRFASRLKRKGAIMFWLADQAEEMQINDETGFHEPYARDTRGELGAYGWGALSFEPNFPVVVGAQSNFPGLRIIKSNFNIICPNFKFYSTLEETCEATVNLSISR